MNRGTQLYPESTTLITEIEANRVQLKPEIYVEWRIAIISQDHVNNTGADLK